MYYFLDLDEQTRLIMICELEHDIQTGMFYNPVSMTDYGLMNYKRVIRICFEKGNVQTLVNSLTSDHFRQYDKNGRKIPSNIREMIAFNDFNRYYIRAMLLRAISEKKILHVCRAKQVKNERKQSEIVINNVYFDERQMRNMLSLFRDYRKLFNMKPQPVLLKPNSGLSLRYVKT